MRLLLPLLFTLTACNGILDGIYDTPSDPTQAEGMPYGFQAIDDDSLGGTIFFNSTSYTRWTYFDLGQFKSDTLDFDKHIAPEALAAIEPTEWDIALHRSVPKTNGGSVAETKYQSLEALVQAAEAAGGAEALLQSDGLTLRADQWGTEQVALDLTGMMSGDVLYLPSYYNATLNHWLDIDISNPPPIYTLSRRAYILRSVSGEHYGLYLVHFRNSQNITSWLTIRFRRL